MCSLHYYFHRDKPNYQGCPFQIQFKGVEPGDAKSFKAVCGTEYHNHDFETAVQYEEEKALLSRFKGRGRPSLAQLSAEKTSADEKAKSNKDQNEDRIISGSGSRDSSYTKQLKKKIALIKTNKLNNL